MTQPAPVTSAADWADLVAALRNEIDLIEGIYAGVMAGLEDRRANADIDDDPDMRAEQETDMTDPDFEAEQAADRELREDYEADGDLDGDYDNDAELDDPDLEA